MLKKLILFVAVTCAASKVSSFEKREAQTQNCFGSNCNQNNGEGFVSGRGWGNIINNS